MAKLTFLINSHRTVDVSLQECQRLMIGRGGPLAQVCEASSLAERHAEISVNLRGRHVLRDLDSVSGTFINDTRIRECELLHGDTIAFGGVNCVYVLDEIEQPERYSLDGLTIYRRAGSVRRCLREVTTGRRDALAGDSSVETDLSRDVAGGGVIVALVSEMALLRQLGAEVESLQRGFTRSCLALDAIRQRLAAPPDDRAMSPEEAPSWLGHPSAVDGDDRLAAANARLLLLRKEERKALEALKGAKEELSQTNGQLASSTLEMIHCKSELTHTEDMLQQKHRAVEKLREEQKDLSNVSYALAQAKARLGDYETTAEMLSNAYRQKRREIQHLEQAVQSATLHLQELERRRDQTAVNYQSLVQQHEELRVTLQRMHHDANSRQGWSPLGSGRAAAQLPPRKE